MSDSIIRVENLSKAYRIGAKESIPMGMPNTIKHMLKSPFKYLASTLRNPVPEEMVWALKDVSFDVYPGEVVGIIGRNGAGKSTLLKILSRITKPTSGFAEIRGRVASLLEVGTGFHPELTGRENVYLNGTILGMTKREVDGKFDEIVQFSGVEKFIDTQVKRYSSGMQVRLAFAVAAHLDPEILIIDEVLAVGDINFQRKCMGKMKEASTEEGRTVLFVSHNMQAISTMTQKCFVLNDGTSVYQGYTSKAIEEYLKLNVNNSLVYSSQPLSNAPSITEVEVLTSEPNNVHISGNPLKILFSIYTPQPINGACLSFQIFDLTDRALVHLWTFDSSLPMCRQAGSFKVICEIPNLRLYIGNYYLKVYFSEPPGGKSFQTISNICPFEVSMYGKRRDFEWQHNSCVYQEDSNWSVNYLG